MKAYFPTRRTGIVFAADLPTLPEIMRVLDQVADLIDVIKVGSPLIYSEGMPTIRLLSDRYQLPVFADLKISDVPHTNRKIIRQVAGNGGAAVMVHGIVGPDGLQDAIDAAAGDLGIIAQLELTNPGGKMFTAGIADDMAALASDMDIYGVQAPGNRPDRVKRIRSIVGNDKVIVCCGVGHQGGTCAEVFAAGGSYAIVGRAIYNAKEPRSAISALLARSEPFPHDREFV